MSRIRYESVTLSPLSLYYYDYHMNSTEAFIATIKRDYPTTETPFLDRQWERAKATLPYQQLRILHNIPFTKTTLVKLGVLYAGGAEVTVTSPGFMEVDPGLVEAFIAAGGRWKQLSEIENEVFDLHLDCAAELIHRLPPTIGTVEITGTGTHKYRSVETTYPVISVDQSRIKQLEGILGTGEAFVRAFETLTQEHLTGKRFLVFGYGKVGKGIAHYLRKKKADVTIVDRDPEHTEKAHMAGFSSCLSTDRLAVEALANTAFAVVTATGVKNVISDNYNRQAFTAPYLANMGGEDEFGDAFQLAEVMCAKRPINFFVENPTLMRYLDPVFYAHNLGIDLLRYANLSNTLHPFPKFLSEEIVHEWENTFGETINFKVEK